MNKTVKKALKITGISLLAIIVLMIVLPFFFKDKIVEVAKKEANKSLNAQVNFTDFGLNLFRNFPNFSLTVDDFSVVGKDEFSKDTLASVKRLNVVIDLMSVFGSEGYKVNRIIVDNPKVNLITLENGHSNLDIFPETEEEPEKPEEETKFKLSLKELKINNAYLVYRDDSTKTSAKIDNLNFSLSGNMTQDFTSLDVSTDIDSVSYLSSGVALLNKAKLALKSKVDADLKNSKYTLGETSLEVNAILLKLEGWVAMPDSLTTDMDIKISAPKTQFKDWLSLIPALYMKDFEKIKTEGNLAFSAFVKGRMQGESYPAFGLNLKVDNASFRYPDLPKAVTNINILANVNNPGGSLDNTVIDIAGFHFEIDKNPFDLGLVVKTPISDPDLNLKAKGLLNLTSLKEVYPMEEELTGLLNIDLSLQGRLSSVEQERYEDFKAFGHLILQNVKYTSADFPHPMNIPTAKLEFTSRYLDLQELSLKTGKSDISAAGKIQSYLQYVFKDETISAQLQTKSNYFALSDFMGESSAAAPAESAASSEASSAIEIPKNINFSLSSAFNKVIYDNIELDNVKGNIELKDQKLSIKNLTLNTLGSAIGVSGYYTSAEKNNPLADLNLDVKELDIQQAFKTFNTIQKLMPIAEHTHGKVSLKMQLNTSLDNTMSPVIKSIQAKGNLQTSKISISDVKVFEMISTATKASALKNPTLDKVNLSFEVQNGAVSVKPFDVKLGNSSSNISGTMGLDQSLAYVMKMKVPRSELGAKADEFVNSLTGKAGIKAPENITFDILIGGTVTKPTIKLGASGMVNDLKDEVKKVVEEKVQEAKAAVNAELDKAIAEAQKQKERMVAEAQKQADRIRSEAKKSGEKLLQEGDNQAQKLIDDAKNPIAKVAAQKAATEVKKQAQKKIDQGNAEADKQANDLVRKAEQEGDKLIETAKTKKL